MSSGTPGKAGAGSGGRRGRKETLLKRIALGPKAEWNKDELLTVVHYQKHLVALVVGLLWGVLGFKGWMGFVGFGVIELLATVAFYRGVLRVDEEVYGSVAEALGDGLPSVVAMFVLCWVLSINLLHPLAQPLLLPLAPLLRSLGL